MRKNVISLLLALVMLVSLSRLAAVTLPPLTKRTRQMEHGPFTGISAAAIWNPAAALPPPTFRS